MITYRQCHCGVILFDDIDLIPDFLVIVREVIAMLHYATFACTLRSHLEREYLVQNNFLTRAFIVMTMCRESDPAARNRDRLAYDQQFGDVVIVLTRLAKDKTILPLVDVLARLALFDFFRRAEVGSVALITVGSVNAGLAAILAGELHLSAGRQIYGSGHIIIDISPLPLTTVNDHFAVIFGPNLKITLLKHNSLFFTGNCILQSLSRLQ